MYYLLCSYYTSDRTPIEYTIHLFNYLSDAVALSHREDFIYCYSLEVGYLYI
jgi:hypothetical protein